MKQVLLTTIVLQCFVISFSQTFSRNKALETLSTSKQPILVFGKQTTSRYLSIDKLYKNHFQTIVKSDSGVFCLVNGTGMIFKQIKPQVVIHLAAKVGGIMDNINNPVNFFDDNILINTNTVKAAYECGVSKFIGVLSTCIYPDKLNKNDYPITEEMLHNGPPTPTNFAYGYAKRC